MVGDSRISFGARSFVGRKATFVYNGKLFIIVKTKYTRFIYF